LSCDLILIPLCLLHLDQAIEAICFVESLALPLGGLETLLDLHQIPVEVWIGFYRDKVSFEIVPLLFIIQLLLNSYFVPRPEDLIALRALVVFGVHELFELHLEFSLHLLAIHTMYLVVKYSIGITG
jgi:hypothetical protein